MKYLFVLFAIALNGMDITIAEQLKKLQQQVSDLSSQVSLLTAYVLRLDTEVKSMQSKQLLLSRSGSSEALSLFSTDFLGSPRRSPKLHKGDDLGN